jgi:hypothetical protein
MIRLSLAVMLTQLTLLAAIQIDAPTDDKFSNSDLVCRGTTAEVRRLSGEGRTSTDGIPGPTDYKLVISPDWCYKGTATSGQIEVGIRVDDPGWGPPGTVGVYVLAFLRKGAGAHFLPVQRIGSFYSFWEIKDRPTNSQNGLLQVERDVVKIAKQTEDLESSKAALRFLLSFRHLDAELQGDLVELSRGSDNDTRLLALEARAKLRARADLGPLMHQLAGELRGRASVDSMGLENLSEVIELESSLEDLDALEEISNCPVEHLRQTAMLAIRRLKAPSSVPFLIDQLGSADTTVQYEALITLAEMTGKGGDFGPAMDKFEKEPAKYRALWLQWWRDEGAQRFPVRQAPK